MQIILNNEEENTIMIEEILEGESAVVDAELMVMLQEAVATLSSTQKLVLWYWLLGFTQEETRHRIFPGRSRAHIWQKKSSALKALEDALGPT